MTSNRLDTDRNNKIARMADALIAHLGAKASAFADRQMREAEGSARSTWEEISAEIERRRNDA